MSSSFSSPSPKQSGNASTGETHTLSAAEPARMACHRLSLCNDVVFKTLFSRHPHLLSDLINAVRYPVVPIQVRRILNPHILPQDLVGKHIILDILAEDEAGRRLGIEMQLQPIRHWPERNVYGVARNLAAQLQAGQDYRQLKPVIGISLLAHDLFHDHPDQAAWHFTLRDTQRPQVQLGQALQIHIIELRKAEKQPELPQPLQAWTACLLHNLDEAAMSEITHPPVKEALMQLEALYSDEELRLAAERREQALIDAEDALDQARYEGELKGLRQSLHTLLQQKFGAVSDATARRIQQAEIDTLQQWLVRVLQADRVNDIFA